MLTSEFGGSLAEEGRAWLCRNVDVPGWETTRCFLGLIPIPEIRSLTIKHNLNCTTGLLPAPCGEIAGKWLRNLWRCWPHLPWQIFLILPPVP